MGDLNHSDDLLKDSVALAEPSSAPEKCNPKELVIPIVCHSTKDAVNQLGIKLNKEVASLTISIITKGPMNEKEALYLGLVGSTSSCTSRAKQWWT